jgi:AraC family transcriptional activator of pobA
VFRLYGETADWPTPDLMHWESIPERSRLHDWEIRPHRHGDLAQILYVRGGTAWLDIEGREHCVEEAAIQMIPALCVHGFRFSRDIDGHVLTIAAPLVRQIESELGGAVAPTQKANHFPVRDDRDRLDALFSDLANEYRHPQTGRELVLKSLVVQLFVWIARHEHDDRYARDSAHDDGRRLLQSFYRLIELHLCEQPPVGRYAEWLNVSGTQLNSLCRRLAGDSALGLIHRRLLLEAKRNLIYTSLTIQQISDLLGFSEPAYFARFFARLAGCPPKRFRELRMQGDPDRNSDEPRSTS